MLFLAKFCNFGGEDVNFMFIFTNYVYFFFLVKRDFLLT